MAELLGKDAALWLPSGTMANQVALRVLTRPGDDVIVSRECHAVWHETGGSAANAGVQFTEIGTRRHFTVDDVPRRAQAAWPRDLPADARCSRSRTRTTARAASSSRSRTSSPCVQPRANTRSRRFSTARACGTPRRRAAWRSRNWPHRSTWWRWRCPRGSGHRVARCWPGRASLIERATRYRRMFGGAMRQTGIYAAAGLFAIEHHRARLGDDHANARLIAERLADHARVDIDLATVQTNIIVFRLKEGAPDAATVVERARSRGVLLFPFGARTLARGDASRCQHRRNASVRRRYSATSSDTSACGKKEHCHDEEDHHRVRRHRRPGRRAGACHPGRCEERVRRACGHAQSRTRESGQGAGRRRRRDRRRGPRRCGQRAARDERCVRSVLRDQLLGALLAGEGTGPGRDTRGRCRQGRREARGLVDARGHARLLPGRRQAHAGADGQVQRAALRRQGRGQQALHRPRADDAASTRRSTGTT